jgi:hypothetical protein
MRRPFLRRVWRRMEGSLNALPNRIPRSAIRGGSRDDSALPASPHARLLQAYSNGLETHHRSDFGESLVGGSGGSVGKTMPQHEPADTPQLLNFREDPSRHLGE